jgi:hypothetical protein
MLLVPAVLMAQSTAPKAPAAKSTTAAPTAKTAPQSASAPKAAAPVLETDEEKTVYALGLQVYRSLAQFDLSPAELELNKNRRSPGFAGVAVEV